MTTVDSRKFTPISDDDDSSYESALHFGDPTVEESEDEHIPIKDRSCRSIVCDSSVESSFVADGNLFDDSQESLDVSCDDGPNKIIVEISFSPTKPTRNIGKRSGSIKDLLSFGSIHENRDYESDDSTDFSSGEFGCSDREDGNYADGDESSVGSDIISSILKTSDSRERIHNSTRHIQTRIPTNPIMRNSDNTQRDFLKHRKSSGKSEGFWKSAPKIQRRKNGGSNKTPEGQNTKGASSRTATKGRKKSVSGDPLMDRFLRDRRKPSFSSKKTESRDNKQEQNLLSADSHHRICGKGKRVVKTLPSSRVRNENV